MRGFRVVAIGGLAVLTFAGCSVNVSTGLQRTHPSPVKGPS
jgi:hypothetical protein